MEHQSGEGSVNFIMVPSQHELALRKADLMSYFPTGDDAHEYDLARMQDTFSAGISIIHTQLARRPSSAIAPAKKEQLLARISTALKSGEDWKLHDVLIADEKGVDPDVLAKFREGVYHIADSSKVPGNLRAAIVDEHNQIKAQLTLKHFHSNGALLADVVQLAIQKSLERISEQLEDISRDVQYLIQLTRGEVLRTPFLNARSYMWKATNASSTEAFDDMLEKADDELLHGLNSLYRDLTDNISTLVRYHDNKKSKLKDIETCVAMIAENIALIPKYVSLRSYLFVFRGMHQDATTVLKDYEEQLRRIVREPRSKKGLTAAQLIHKYFPYERSNRDFWLHDIDKIYQMLSSATAERLQNGDSVYYLSSTEDDENGVD